MEEQTQEVKRESKQNGLLGHRQSVQGLILQAAVWSNGREPVIHLVKQSGLILTGMSWR